MKIIDKVYGETEISEPVILKVLETSPLQRLKKINQAGTQIVLPHKQTTRFDHCLGTMLLLRRFGADLEEQIAGLLHDVTHTVFSHTVDFAFGNRQKQDYHEKFLEKIVFTSQIPEILVEYGIDPFKVTDAKNFSLLEQDIPALCADRIDYSLRDLVRDRVITQDKAQEILGALTAFEGSFVMTNENLALEYAQLFMKECLESWNHPIDLVTSEILGIIVRTALKEKVLTQDDLFTTEEEVLLKLKRSKDNQIHKYLELLTPNLRFETSEKKFDFDTRGKVRYIDPLVKIETGIKKLSELNQSFASTIPKFVAKVKKGYKIKIITQGNNSF